MLARLESALGRNDLIEQMVLRPEPVASASDSKKSVNLVVGYSSSPRSQTALDLALWMAHQTRIATSKPVTVQVVYVLDENQISQYSDLFNLTKSSLVASSNCENTESAQPVRKWLAASSRLTSSELQCFKTISAPITALERADHILWQARCLAEEWRGSFTAHLRFGNIAKELRKVVEEEAATLLFLGCKSANHSIIRELGDDFPCAVLGIPTNLMSTESFDSSSDCLSI
ncbi:MAG TPA: universal stress protein [Oscillatoriaceae cyanobacterium M7585_C2015_266]|nr:universal stress protein [Oscillatoriaceae cyanobacterium M7585_C2015_266]